MKFEVVSLSISEKRGVQKHEVQKIECIAGYGIERDAHAGNWHRQVTLLAKEVIEEAIERINKKGKNIFVGPGSFAENIVTRGVDWSEAKVGGKIKINEVEMEVTQKGKEYDENNPIFKITGEYLLPIHGVFAKIIKGGKIRVNDCGYYSFG